MLVITYIPVIHQGQLRHLLLYSYLGYPISVDNYSCLFKSIVARACMTKSGKIFALTEIIFEGHSAGKLETTLLM